MSRQPSAFPCQLLVEVLTGVRYLPPRPTRRGRIEGVVRDVPKQTHRRHRLEAEGRPKRAASSQAACSWMAGSP